MAPPSHFTKVYNQLEPETSEQIIRSTLVKTYNLGHHADTDVWYNKYKLWCDKTKTWRYNPNTLSLLIHQNWNIRTTVDYHRDNLSHGTHVEDFGYLPAKVEAVLVIDSPWLKVYLNLETRASNNVAKPYDGDFTDPFLWVDAELNLPTEIALRPNPTPNSPGRIQDVPKTPTETGDRRSYSTHTVPVRRSQLIFLGYIKAKLETADTGYYAVAKMSDNRDGTIEGIFALPLDSKDMADEDLLHSPPRGIYYLGRDFDDIAGRGNWELCKELGSLDLKVYPGRVPEEESYGRDVGKLPGEACGGGPPGL